MRQNFLVSLKTVKSLPCWAVTWIGNIYPYMTLIIVRSKFEKSAIYSFVRMKELRLWCKIQNENIFQGENYREIDGHEKLTRGFADVMSERVLLKPQRVFSVLRVLVGIKCIGALRIVTGGKQ